MLKPTPVLKSGAPPRTTYARMSDIAMPVKLPCYAFYACVAPWYALYALIFVLHHVMRDTRATLLSVLRTQKRWQ